MASDKGHYYGGDLNTGHMDAPMVGGGNVGDANPKVEGNQQSQQLPAQTSPTQSGKELHPANSNNRAEREEKFYRTKAKYP